MDANEIKTNRKTRLGNKSISDFFKPKVWNTDGNNNASSSVISKVSEQGKGNDSNQCTLPPVVTTPDIQTSASVSTTPVIQTSVSVSTTPDIQTSASVSKVQHGSKTVPKYQPQWEGTYKWLSLGANGMLCSLCMKSGKTNPFTKGCINYRTSTLTRHVDSGEHQQALRDSVWQENFTAAALASVRNRSEKSESINRSFLAIDY